MKDNQKYKITFADGSTHVFTLTLNASSRTGKLLPDKNPPALAGLFPTAMSWDYLAWFLNTVVKAEEVEETANLGDYFKITSHNSTGYYILMRTGFDSYYLVNVISGIVWDTTPLSCSNIPMSLLQEYINTKLSGLVNAEIIKIGNHEDYINATR